MALAKTVEKRKPGAPTRLSAELIERVSNVMRGGVYYETAFAHCGVKKQLYKLWLEKGNLKPKSIYGALIAEIDRALADAEIRDIQCIDQAAMGRPVAIPFKDKDGVHIKDKDGMVIYLKPIDPDWRAAAHRLERRFGDRWGSRVKVDLPPPPPATPKPNDLTPTERNALIEQLMRERALTHDE